MLRSSLSLALIGAASAASYTLDVRDWVVDYQRQTTDPRKAPYDVNIAVKKAAFLANDSYPGPALEVFEGDTLEVTVMNNLMGAEIDLAWSCVSSGSCTMVTDSVERIKPQGFNTTYRLQATSAGNFQWSAKLPMQAARGLKGPLLIKRRNDPFAHEYQEEKYMVLSDEWRMPEVCIQADGSLLQGCPEIDKATLNGQWGDDSKDYPLPLWEVKKGQCYRLHFLALVSQPYDFEVSISDHQMLIFGPNATDPSAPMDTITVPHGSGLDALLCASKGSVLGGDHSINMTYIGKTQRKSFSATLRYPKFSKERSLVDDMLV